jgi:NADPH-dependent 2,4-dienoyl-CoA reductase/sulfur reductase-like enzyme
MTKKRVVIVGGVAGGATCAARLRRLDEDAVSGPGGSEGTPRPAALGNKSNGRGTRFKLHL